VIAARFDYFVFWNRRLAKYFRLVSMSPGLPSSFKKLNVKDIGRDAQVC